MDRRRGAAELLLRAGYSQVSIAGYLNVAQGTISRWSRGSGLTGKKGRPRRGQNPDAVPKDMIAPEARLGQAKRPTFLTLEQIREVLSRKLLWEWTGQKFADALFRAYGVRYSRSHASALLAQLARKEGAA
jgi:transposase